MSSRRRDSHNIRRSRAPSILGDGDARVVGGKRPRESDLDDEIIEERPLRIKIEAPPHQQQGDSYSGPPPAAPPIPRDDDECVREKTEVVEKPKSPDLDIRIAGNVLEDETSNHSSGPAGETSPLVGPSSGVKGEGCGVESREGVHKGGAGNPSDRMECTTTPSVSNFFNFTATPQIDAPLPNAMKSDIKHKPVSRPQMAPYYIESPEEERNYVGEDAGKIKTIPMPSKEGEDDSESDVDDEKKEAHLENSRRFSRYFKSSTVYSKYIFTNPKIDTTRLAVYDRKPHILNSLDKARVVIVEGFTGCGKTTQIPQYILDKCYQDQRICNIVVTQPRKIAAVSVAKRVCKERNWDVGSVVGYQVGMENKTDKKDTLLTFMTTGVLLQKLISLKSLKDFTHIIIDEVHERDLESDFLLLVIKKIMQADKGQKESHVKLILMSATIDTKKFENYFVFEQDGEEIRPHVIKIPFVTRHRVEELYLDDLLLTKIDQLNQIQTNMLTEKASIHEDIYDVAVSCIISMDEIEREANVDPRMRKQNTEYPKHRGAVLVFLPGMEEIKRLQRALEKENQDQINHERNKMRDPNFYKWVILPLHSSVTHEEQNRCFDSQGDRFRKIILSTNIAESSVTVPDIEYVIDFCVTKSLYVDKTTNFTTLQMAWAAKSQCTQRKGRTGRVTDGKVYRLVPRSFFAKLENDILPEMQRSNLETVILMCKKFNFESPANLLRDCMDYPKLSGIKRAVATLKELGALTVEMVDKAGNIKYDTSDGDLTFVGKVMSDLPIPQQCTRLILLGHCFGVMQEAIIIAAGLSVKSPFQSAFQKQLNTYLEKMKHAKKSFSDLFALYHVYKFWMHNYKESGENYGNRKQFNEFKWARGAMVHITVLWEIKSTVELLEERLKKLGITDSYALAADPNNTNPVELSSERGMFLKMAIAGAFYPCYFLRRRPELKQYEKEINREVNGNDPFRTVYFKGFPPGHEGQLYAKNVSEHLSCGLSVPSVKFDGQKVLAIFDNSTGDTIGPFNTGIFRAIKKRQLRSEQLEFKMLWKTEERSQVDAWMTSVQRRNCIPCPSLRFLPPVDTHSLNVHVQHVISPSQFWVILKQDFDKVQALNAFINHNLSPIMLPSNKLYPNVLCLAPFLGEYYRAKLLRIDNNAKSLVYFVDYGNSHWVPSSCLYDFSPFLLEKGVAKEPCMAIECRLKEVKPNIVYGLHWCEESIDFMKKFCEKAPNLEFKIFSISQSIMAGELLGFSNEITERCSLNRMLLVENDGKLYGEVVPEPFRSMENHRVRMRARYMEREEKMAAGVEQYGDPLDLDFIDPPKNGKTPVTLKGPWSPLEMSFQAMVQCSITKEVRVENSSVNSVLLDHEPTTSNSRLLVGAHVSVANVSQACIIRDSTIMPAIPGILSLVALMFAPRVELRVDRSQSKYTGVLCGCGTIQSSKDPSEFEVVHPDNDMEIVFDTVIDDKDIDKINIIRYNLNLILRNSRGVNKSGYHKRLREEVIRLLRTPRTTIDEEIWAQEEYVWNRISPKFLEPCNVAGMSFSHEDIFQPHRKVLLNQVVEKEVRWNGMY